MNCSKQFMSFVVHVSVYSGSIYLVHVYIRTNPLMCPLILIVILIMPLFLISPNTTLNLADSAPLLPPPPPPSPIELPATIIYSLSVFLHASLEIKQICHNQALENAWLKKAKKRNAHGI